MSGDELAASATRPAWLSVVLISVGAVLGGLALFWSIIAPSAVAVVVAMNLALARQASAAS